MIIRVWSEDGSAVPLRAQVSVTHDVEGGIERTMTLVHAADVTQVVDDWILDMVGPAAATPVDHPDG